ncbi:MAG: hypothetical protein GX330_06785, partial [Bacteroidales bacterium]|nr:hypothetical protein [Bacteroidales bacterium]
MKLIEKLNKAIDIEYDAKNSEIDELLLTPIEDRILKGETISNIEIEILKYSPVIIGAGNTGDGRIYLQFDENRINFSKVKIFCKNNYSKFREGSPVIL